MRAKILVTLLAFSFIIAGCLGGSGSTGTSGTSDATPTAALDSYRVLPGEQFACPAPGLLANDSEDLWVDSYDASSLYGGTVIVDVDGSFQYDPPSSGFMGQDSFTYTATDGVAYETAPVLVIVDYLQIDQLTKLLASDANALDYFGVSIAVSGDIAVVGADGEDTGGSSAGAAYILERDGSGNWLEAAKLTASDAQADDRFGVSVAVSGDTAVVGAPYGDTGVSNTGAAYVFERNSSGGWSQAARLIATDPDTGDYFGWPVAVSGDTVVIGAYGEDTGGYNAGAAYVYERDGSGTWSQGTKLTASDTEIEDYFGVSVAISEDIAVVGAFKEDAGGIEAGAAYVFERDGSGTWSQATKLTVSDSDAYDWFGRSAAVSGDSAVVGAHSGDTSVSNSGAAYVFRRDGSGTWSQEAKLAATDPEAADYFGGSVDLEGDSIVVGADGEDAGGSGAGAAYLFKRDVSGNWLVEGKLIASDPQANDKFGHSVAVLGKTLLVGAHTEGAGGGSAGAVYVFEPH